MSIESIVVTLPAAGITAVNVTHIGVAGMNGKSAYESYLDTTSDDPPLTEEEWSDGADGADYTAPVPQDLGAITALVPESVYYHDALTSRPFTFSTALTNGQRIEIQFVCSAEITLQFPSSRRVGDTALTTSVTFPAGNHVIVWRKLGTLQTVADSAWQETAPAPDTDPPTISTLSPLDGSADVAVGSNLVVTFNESIQAGTGNVTIKNLTAATETTIAIGDAQCSISGAVLTINPTADLTAGKSYAIRIASTAIEDLSGNPFAGIANDTTWNFATAVAPDVTAPTISSLSPVDGASAVAIGSNLVATFSEAIQAGTGNVTIKNLTDATEINIAIGDAQCVISGNTLTINPTADLVAGKSYAIRIASTAIRDLASPANYFAGIADDTTWNFATAAAASTSYANAGGTGDRTASITTSAAVGLMGGDGNTFRLVNGNMSESNTYFINAFAVSGSVYLRFDFGSAKVIDEAKFYQQNSTTHGTWKWQGSNNATDWTDIGSPFTLGGAATQTITALSGNMTSYRYYQIVGVSGVTSNNPYLYEFEFKIS